MDFTNTSDNRRGTLNSLQELTVSAGAMDNRGGTVGEKTTADLTTTSLDNREGGRLVSEGELRLHTGGLQNSHGQILSVDDMLLDSVQGVVDNVSGLIRSGASVTLNALQFINRHTLDTGQGLEAQAIHVTTQNLDNQEGSILADRALTVMADRTLSNNDGDLSSGATLSVSGRQLAFSNRDGVVKAGQSVSVDAGQLAGDGKLLSLGDMMLKSNTTFSDSGQTIANGNLTLSVNGDVTNTGSLLAGSRLDLNSIRLENTEKGEISAGLTLALSGTAGSALNTTVETVQAAKSAGNSRSEALLGVKAALSGAQAVQAGRLADAQGSGAGNNNTVGVSLSYGSQSSKSEQRAEQTVAKGSTLTAGNNLSIQAAGSGVKGLDGDLTIQGSQIKAGNNVLLQANRDVDLVSAENTSKLEGKNTSSGGSVGVGIGVGPGGPGLSLSASVNKGKGSEKGNGTTHTETTVDAGNRLTLRSGRDTTLTGAQAGGETVKVDAGRHLTLTSEQDSDRYDSRQQTTSAGGSLGAGSGSVSVNLSRDKMHSNYDSVQEQTGIFAGRGGFDVTTGQHTQLNGAVIASTATADKNRLDTGTLGFSDIENRADFKTEHQSAGLSTGGSVAGNFLGNMANNLLVGANHEGHADSTTQSAVSAGNITIRDTQGQKQDVAALDRDAAHASQTLSPIFDREKEQQRLQQAQLIGEIGNQVADIARTEGQIAGEKAKRDPAALAQARAELAATGKPFTEQDVVQRACNTGMAASGFGTGGKYQQAIQAATAAVQGLAGGNLSAALAGGAAPYLAEVVKTLTTDPVTGEVNKAANVAAHAVVNAALAVAQGKNALAGAAGAGTGEIVGMIATEMYHKPVSELSETEKQTVSTLATVAAGLAGGLVGDSGASAIAGAQSGKTTVENNTLAVPAPVPVPGVPVGPGDKVKQDADKNIASGLEGAIKDLSEALDKATQCSFGRACSSDDSAQTEGPNAGKNLTDAEKAELGGGGTGTPGGWGPDNEEKARHQEVQQQRFDELSNIYDKNHPAGELTVDGQTIRQSPASNRYGTTKVFESQNLTDKQIHNYAQQLAGDTPLKEVKSGIYTSKLSDGSVITLRNISTSEGQTGARWTIDIRNNQKLTELGNKYSRVEIKFK